MKKKSGNKKANFIRYILILWGLAIGAMALAATLFLGVSYGMLGSMPTFEELENPKSNLASEMISSDYKVLGTYYIQNRSNVTYNDLSENIVNALVATEDVRFFNHSGIDARGLLRVLFKTVILRQNTGGGSTLTQQLAKMLFHERPKSLVKRVLQKLKEWVIAVKLEKQYTKEEIISMYLNKFDFINNAVGIKSAAHVYFNTTPEDLKLEEAALLVGMAKNPSLYNPLRFTENALGRRNVVLFQLNKYGYISDEVYDSVKVLPIELSYQSAGHDKGISTYFREYIREKMKEWCKTHMKPDGEPYNLYKDGLKIYTTINSTMQIYAEEAVRKHLSEDLQPTFFKHIKNTKNAPFSGDLTSSEIYKLIIKPAIHRTGRYKDLKEKGLSEDAILKEFKKPVDMKVFSWHGDIDTVMSPYDSILYYKSFLQAGLISLDPVTGYIRAYVGGTDFEYFKYDHVIQGKRQVGSLFKPFLYTLAMQEGWTPCRQVPNVPVVFKLDDGSEWSPENADGKYGGVLTLKEGLATSTNTITSYIMKQFSPEAVIDIARKMGVTSHIDPYPSICLGTPDISLYEMVSAFSSFANKGVWVEPVFVTRIEDKNGNVLEEYVPHKVEAISEGTAYLMLRLLEGTTKKTGEHYGTAIRIRTQSLEYGGFTNQIAGKTGTTQNQSDGWFIGIVPDLVTGVWVGCEDRAAHFRSLSLGQGANTALPIWGWYMKAVFQDSLLGISPRNFDEPEYSFSKEWECEENNNSFGGNSKEDPFAY